VFTGKFVDFAGFSGFAGGDVLVFFRSILVVFWLFFGCFCEFAGVWGWYNTLFGVFFAVCNRYVIGL